MAAEEAVSDLEARIRAASRKQRTCSVCDWIATRSDEEQATWDSIMALDFKVAWHTVIEAELAKLDFVVSDSTIAAHRRNGHRRG